MTATYTTGGQVCMAIKRLYAPAERVGELAEAVLARCEREVVGDGLADETTLGPLHTAAGRDRVAALVADAEAHGASVRTAGRIREADADAGGYFALPTVVTDLAPDSALATEEQFGPVLPIFGYDGIDDAVTAANATEFGLTASVWTGDDALADRIAGQLVRGYGQRQLPRPGRPGPATAVRRLRPVRHRPRTRRRRDPGLHPAADFRPAPGAPLAGPRAPLAAPAPGGEELGPGDHLGVLLEQRPPLAFGHATPNTELDLVVERVGETLGDDGTLPANIGRFPLRRPANEEFVGIGGKTQRLRHPRDAGVGIRTSSPVIYGRTLHPCWKPTCASGLRSCVGVRPPGNDYSGAVQRCLSADQSVRGMNRASPDWGKRRQPLCDTKRHDRRGATEKVRVVVGDDHPLFRDGLVRALTSSGAVDVVAEADDGVAALALIKTHLPHVALLDYRMPGMDGAKVAAAVRRDDLPTRVLLLSAHDESAIVFHALAEGAAGFLPKESTKTEIVKGVLDCANGRDVVSPALAAGLAGEIRRRGEDPDTGAGAHPPRA